ncbi:hypothetical protein B0I33_105512 [Prauserella shujinwangii]|uniref:Uncharacterized protein n=2 Tax=Prauserella shujinwangii TaxID=1453103 RepID=A0A2T0LVT7_9PSEU|nr:hypothetical protein B0I33_105512 [Prauserella shujinwangii]
MLACIGPFVFRRRRTTPPGVTAVGYARAQVPLLVVFAVVTLIEALLFLLLDLGPVVDTILVVLPGYSLLFTVGMLAATVVRASAVRVEGGELVLKPLFETNLVVRLRHPAPVSRPLGRTAAVSILRCYADEPDILLTAVR